MTKYSDKRPTATSDTECYPNYWSIAFRDIATKRVVRLRRTRTEELDRTRLAKIMRNWRIVTFNGINYDLPMIALAMTGASNAVLKAASDELILTNKPYWMFMEERGLKLPDFIDVIDWQEVSPGSPQMPSLKIYAGRLHSKRMQELPFPIDTVLTAEQMVVLENYHDNDLEVTEDGYLELKAQIDLRALMSDEYGVDLRSKSDAQVAEAVIKAEIERITGKRLYKPKVKADVFRYQPPAYVKFKTPQLQQMLERLKKSTFTIRADGKVVEPDWLAGLEMPIGTGVFRMGIGGLHSSEKNISQVVDDDEALLDRDVTSYYPAIILMMGLFPKHIGPVFLKVFRRIFERRLHAKAMSRKCAEAGDKAGALHWGNIAETLKIVLNGCFGKFGSPYSVLFSPDLMIATTITGQLSVLMLIEDLFLQGMEVVSANTDGFVTKVLREQLDKFHAMIFDWECETGLGTEETEYKALYSQGVNGYLAIDKDGKPKRKGKNFTPAGPGLKGASGMKKNPYVEICALAVIAFLKDGTPFLDTIKASRDFRHFVAVTRVNGGAIKDGEEVGGALRYYYSTSTRTAIYRVDSGGTVPRSMGAKLCLEMPDEFPDDIDYAWYVREATAVLADFGFDVQDPKFEGRKGLFTGILADQKTYHSVRMPSAVSVCGKRPKSMRETWEEPKTLNPKFRMCSKCVKGGDL